MREKPTRKRRFTRRGVSLAATLAAVMLALPALALAHLERPSYWPDPSPDNSVSPPAGGKVPKARSLKSAVSVRTRRRARRRVPPGDVLVVCKGTRGAHSLALLRASVRKARKKGYRLRPSQPKHQALQARGPAAARHQPRPGRAVRLPLGPGGGSRRGQQRPDPDHAGPLHRAELAQGPRERPEVQPEPAPEGRQWGPHPELRVPGHLPQRPEPDLRAGARRHRRTASAAALGPQRDPARRSSAGACGATCRSRAPGRSPRT